MKLDQLDELDQEAFPDGKAKHLFNPLTKTIYKPIFKTFKQARDSSMDSPMVEEPSPLEERTQPMVETMPELKPT